MLQRANLLHYFNTFISQGRVEYTCTCTQYCREPTYSTTLILSSAKVGKCIPVPGTCSVCFRYREPTYSTTLILLSAKVGCSIPVPVLSTVENLLHYFDTFISQGRVDYTCTFTQYRYCREPTYSTTLILSSAKVG